MITKEREVIKMINHDEYIVYDNRTNKIVVTGTFAEIEDYVENEGRYTVVHAEVNPK